jgi:acyl-CoA reductase-like NAD-dependent aldehyde dehydrogenase
MDLLIDGRDEQGRGATVDVSNPATEELLASLHRADIEQVDRAVAARRTFEGGRWTDLTPKHLQIEWFRAESCEWGVHEFMETQYLQGPI